MKTGISTKTESHTFSRILDSLGIASKAYPEKVSINRRNDIQRAAELPLFRFASGRQNKLDTLAEMYRFSQKAGYMNDAEKQLIREMSVKGFGLSDVRMKIWSELGVSRSTVAILRYRTKILGNESETE